jgi:hypothetical protein
VLQKLTLDGFRYLVRRTPVDTGFLRSRWAVNTGYVVPRTVSQEGEVSFGPPAEPNVSRIEWGDVVQLYNNAEYASYIEEGTPKMRAQPMALPTVSYLTAEADRVLSSLRAKRYA